MIQSKTEQKVARGFFKIILAFVMLMVLALHACMSQNHEHLDMDNSLHTKNSSFPGILWMTVGMSFGKFK